jgi:glucose-6-phosphate 1-epimerase
VSRPAPVLKSRLSPEGLQNNDDIASIYPRKFSLVYTVTLYETKLQAEVQVCNQSSDIMPFQLLLHNYLRCVANDAQITPLQGIKFYDKTASTEEDRETPKVEDRLFVDVHTFTDSVYEDAPQNYQLTWPGANVGIKTQNFKDVVVWNPQAKAGSKIGDMEDGGWYVCQLFFVARLSI